MIDSLAGNGRFEIIRQLGAGGMGIVYEALDRDLNTRVALKTIRTTEATALYRFKREFRSLAELSHANLLPLYELFADGDHWFFTMELVRGVDFFTFVRSAEAPMIDSSVIAVDLKETKPSDLTDPASVLTGPWVPSSLSDMQESTRTDEPQPARIDLEPTELDPRPGPTPERTAPITHGPVDETSVQSREPDRTRTFTDTATIGGPGTSGRQYSGTIDLQKLRPALRQLCDGVHALHRAGKLHRDIKPSNVLVTPEGRVVLLDFGLIAELEDVAILSTSGSGLAPAANGEASSGEQPGIAQTTESGTIVGSVSYMAPEQASGAALGEASDWYAVGVVLYLCLTGRLPFEGAPGDVLRRKQEIDLAPPSSLVAEVPKDLDDLCIALLDRNPDKRPKGEVILERLREASGEGQVIGLDEGSSDLMPFVGREGSIETIESAYDEMVGGRTVLLEVKGRSGVGKSSLVRRFLDRLAEDRDALVLSGRCYEQESSPYKGLDGLVDSLSRYLLRMADEQVKDLLPASISGLTRLFPVLMRVPAIFEASEQTGAIVEPQELRRSAFAALREILTTLGAREPLILVLDDLQWGDDDGAALLLDLLRPPEPPQFLLIALYRSEYDDTSPSLQALRAAGAIRDPALVHLTLALEPLNYDEARRLALRILGERGSEARRKADRIAKESGGIPYFVGELARQLQAEERPAAVVTPGGELDLEGVIWDRFGRLSSEKRKVLELVSVATVPIRLRDLFEASEIGTSGHAVVTALRAARLLRRSGPGLDDEVETFHDRVRETIVARTEPEVLRKHHDKLATTLSASGHSDAETIAFHFQQAGRLDEAGEAFERAADGAARALAFDRAAKLYRLSLDLRPVGGEGGRTLRLRLAEALANAGRGAEAAREFLEIAATSDPVEALELEGRAAYQYCISGRVDEGLEILRNVMKRVGLRMSETPGQALLSLLLGRLRLSLRGLAASARPIEAISREELTRIDVTWSASTGLTVVDTIRAADLQTTNLLMALRAGEPARLSRALAWEAAHAGVGGVRSSRRVHRLLHAAREIASGQDSPYLDALILLAEGTGTYFRGDFAASRVCVERSVKIFRERCTGAAWELGTALSFLVWALYWLGDLAELSRLVPTLIREARERDDRYLETNLCSWGSTLGFLARDEPIAAEDALREAMRRWTRTSFHSQHMLEIGATVQIHLYRGDGTTAFAGVAHTGPPMRRSGLLRVQVVRGMYYSSRALSLLAAAHRLPDARRFIALASRDAKRLLREDAHYCVALGRLIRAAVSFHRGLDPIHDLGAAIRDFESLGMVAFEASARYRMGQVIGGDEGRLLRERAIAVFQAQGVVAPERMIDVHAPAMDRPLTDRSARSRAVSSRPGNA